MNKQGPGKIDWTDYTWNPISGCLHGCHYCYMRRMEKRFKWIMKPAFHPERLKEIYKIKKPSKIFVSSSGDMWGEWVKDKWIGDVLRAIDDNPRHTYQFLTKNPRGYEKWDLQSHTSNCWFGTTVDGTDQTKDNLDDFTLATGSLCRTTRFISFEPLLFPVDPDLDLISWIIIGADSTRGAKKPPKEWADHLIEKARALNIPVWVKDNYGYPEIIKEFPTDRKIYDSV